MMPFPANCSCSPSRVQTRVQEPLAAPSSDGLKQQCSTGGMRGRAARRSRPTLRRAVSPSVTERPSVVTEVKSSAAAPAKQEVVSYNGIQFEVTDKPELKSTWSHRVVVACSSLVLCLLFAQGVSHSNSGFVIAGCALAGYVFAGA